MKNSEGLSDNKYAKVTVITIVLNAVEVIERTLKSVIQQNYPNLEYIVVDGASLDGTVQLIEKYKNDIDIFVSEKDGGIYSAMNKGADISTGDWIIYMNGGDVFVDSNVISEVFLKFHSVISGADVVFGDGIFNHEGYRVVGYAPDKPLLNDGNGFSHQSTFVKASLQKTYRFDISERIAADYDLFLRLYKDGKLFKHVDVVISEFFTGGFSDISPFRTIKLRDRIYRKYFRRSILVLYFRLFKALLKTILKNIIPNKIWTILKNLSHRSIVVKN